MTSLSRSQRRAASVCGQLNRRAFLGGAAAVVSLPFLETLAFSAVAPRRAVWMFMPNGMWLSEWGPGKETLKTLNAFEGRYAVVNGLSNKAATLGARGSHAQGTGCWLTCVKVEHESPKAGVSADQVAARVLGEGRRVGSLQVTYVNHFLNRTDGVFNNPVYHNHISWATATQPLEPVGDPKALFDRLFAGFDPSESKTDRMRRLERKASVLDYVAEQSKSLKPRLAMSDQTKLDEFYSSVRELEQEVEQIRKQEAQTPAGQSACGGVASLDESSLTARSQTVNTLIALSFQCDITRVVSNMMTKPQDTNALFTFIPKGAGNHHNASHKPSPGGLLPIDKWHMERVADLMTKLDAIDDGDGRSALDNTAIVFGNELSNGETHSRNNVPMMAAGGLFNTSQHINHVGTIDELHLTALHAVGVKEASFGAFAKAPIAALLR